jgi:hypothetical protein
MVITGGALARWRFGFGLIHSQLLVRWRRFASPRILKEEDN